MLYLKIKDECLNDAHSKLNISVSAHGRNWVGDARDMSHPLFQAGGT